MGAGSIPAVGPIVASFFAAGLCQVLKCVHFCSKISTYKKTSTFILHVFVYRLLTLYVRNFLQVFYSIFAGCILGVICSYYQQQEALYAWYVNMFLVFLAKIIGIKGTVWEKKIMNLFLSINTFRQFYFVFCIVERYFTILSHPRPFLVFSTVSYNVTRKWVFYFIGQNIWCKLRHFFVGFFIPGFPKLKRFQDHHEAILKKFAPKLFKHLVSFVT